MCRGFSTATIWRGEASAAWFARRHWIWPATNGSASWRSSTVRLRREVPQLSNWVGWKCATRGTQIGQFWSWWEELGRTGGWRRMTGNWPGGFGVQAQRWCRPQRSGPGSRRSRRRLRMVRSRTRGSRPHSSRILLPGCLRMLPPESRVGAHPGVAAKRYNRSGMGGGRHPRSGDGPRKVRTPGGDTLDNVQPR